MKTSSLPPNELRHNTAAGIISIDLPDPEDFKMLCSAIGGYTPERFEGVALKVYMENSPVVTVYALDLERQETEGPDYFPVRKFKKEISLPELLGMLGRINFTITTGKYDIAKMKVLNK